MLNARHLVISGENDIACLRLTSEREREKSARLANRVMLPNRHRDDYHGHSEHICACQVMLAARKKSSGGEMIVPDLGEREVMLALSTIRANYVGQRGSDQMR